MRGGDGGRTGEGGGKERGEGTEIREERARGRGCWMEEREVVCTTVCSL